MRATRHSSVPKPNPRAAWGGLIRCGGSVVRRSCHRAGQAFLRCAPDVAQIDAAERRADRGRWSGGNRRITDDICAITLPPGGPVVHPEGGQRGKAVAIVGVRQSKNSNLRTFDADASAAGWKKFYVEPRNAATGRRPFTSTARQHAGRLWALRQSKILEYSSENDDRNVFGACLRGRSEHDLYVVLQRELSNIRLDSVENALPLERAVNARLFALGNRPAPTILPSNRPTSWMPRLLLRDVARDRKPTNPVKIHVLARLDVTRSAQRPFSVRRMIRIML